MATPQTYVSNLSETAHDLRALLGARKVFIRELAKSKDREEYKAVEFIESRINVLVWDVEEQLLERREVTHRPDIAATFSADVLERLIDKRNDNDQRIREADPSDDCAKLLAKDEAINGKIEAVVLAAITELQQYLDKEG